MNKSITYFTLLSIFLISTTDATDIATDNLTFTSHNVKTNNNQQTHNTLEALRMPIDTSAQGFTNFLRNSYNQPMYAQDFLPNDFSHCMQFLEHGKKTKQTRSYTQSALRLFSNKLKSSTYINAQAYDAMLQQLPSLLDHQFMIQKAGDIHLMQEKINKLMYNSFLQKFSTFKSDHNTFFQDLSDEILQALGGHEQDGKDIGIEELRKTMLIFLEVGLSKLIWSPHDSLDTWKSVKTISEHLTDLADSNIIIDEDDLNDLFVTLIARYCYFIEIASIDLPASFYHAIKQDISNSSLFMLEMEELEPYMQTKKDLLLTTLKTSESFAKQARNREFID